MKKSIEEKPTALIVDDEESICQTLEGVLSDEGWNSYSSNGGSDALILYRSKKIDLVLLDVWMEGLDGIETLQRMKEFRRDIPIVIMSGHGTIETAVKATKLGAFDFLEKPLSLEKLIPLIEYARKLRHADEQQILPDSRLNNVQLIGESPAISAIQRKISVVAPRNSWVFVTGENGTGKEIVARNIHLQSKRAEKAFVAVNCAAIPEELIESELFGYTKGAFTSAVSDKKGKFELAHHGTLFLDEIGDMSLKTQAKILRILQEQSFERLGGNETISVDVRVIAATNKDLMQEIKEGRFREDLFYRLNVIPIELTPLRDRKEDIMSLANYFCLKMSKELGEESKKFTTDAARALELYSWPGNVRELKNLVERLNVLVAKNEIELADLPKYFKELDVGLQPSSLGSCEVSQDNLESDELIDSASLKEARNQFERGFILGKLQEHGWNISKTAEAIGIERSNLHKKLRNYGIDLKRLKI